MFKDISCTTTLKHTSTLCNKMQAGEQGYSSSNKSLSSPAALGKSTEASQVMSVFKKLPGQDDAFPLQIRPPEPGQMTAMSLVY